MDYRRESRVELRLERGRANPPAAVTAVLRGTADLSAACAADWAWILEPRRVHLYHTAGPNPTAHSLGLPASGLKYTAALVALLPSRDDPDAIPGLLAASPEGLLRFWPTLAIDSRNTELTLELGGQVCDSLTPIGTSRFFLLATTTAHLFLIHVNPGGSKLTATELRGGSGGVLSGITRRLGSLIWAPSASSEAAAPADSRLIRVVEMEGGAWVIKTQEVEEWWLGEDQDRGGTLQFSLPLIPLLQNALMEEVWHLTSPSAKREYSKAFKCWILDGVRWGEGGLLLLVAAVNTAITFDVTLSLALLKEPMGDTQSLDGLAVLPRGLLGKLRTEGSDWNPITRFRLVWPGSHEPASSPLYVVGSGFMAGVRLDDSLRLLAHQSMPSEEETMGTGCLSDGAAVFRRHSGLIMLRLQPRQPHNCLSEPRLDERMDMGMESGTRDLSYLVGTPDRRRRGHDEAPSFLGSGDGEDDEVMETFRRAFVLFSQHNLAEAGRLVNDVEKQGRDLALLVANLSFDILDDYPEADPRWTQHHPPLKTRKKSSLLIETQLDDKRRTLDLLAGFVEHFAFWPKLGRVQTGEREWGSVQEAMAEHGERVSAGHALIKAAESLPPDWTVFEQAISRVVKGRPREEEEGPELTPADLFFRKMSGVEDVLPALVEECLRGLEKLERARQTDHLQHLERTLSLVAALLTRITTRRQDWSAWWCRRPVDTLRLPHWHWLLVPVVRNAITRLVDIALKRCIGKGAEAKPVINNAEKVIDNYLELFVAFERQSSESEADWARKVSATLATTRQALLRPLFVDLGNGDRARALAERHGDLDSLLQLSSSLGPEERAEAWKDWTSRFEDQGFPDLLYRHLYTRGEEEELMRLGASELEEAGAGNGSQAGERRFRAFLADKPHLRWKHEVRAGDYMEACDTVLGICDNENSSAAKREGYASVAKLCVHESGLPVDGTRLARAELFLQLAKHHKRLIGLDPLQMDWGPDDEAPRSADAVVRTRMARLPTSASRGDDASLALDVAQCLRAPNPDRRDWRRLKDTIWESVIAADAPDSWTRILNEKEAKAAVNTLFSVTLNSIINLNMSPDMLPDVDMLLSSKTLPTNITQNAFFQHLLRTADEKARQALSKNAEDEDSMSE